MILNAERILGFPPSLEQQRLARYFVTNQHFISCAVGVPGSGKTSAVKLCRESWDKLGVNVIGLSFKAKSAQELRQSSGIKDAMTVDRFLKRYDPKDKKTWPAPGSVIVVDEASEISTSRLVRLVGIAEHSQCRIVLLGDDHQRASIEAGGMFATLMRSLGGVVLAENKRQKEGYEREAVALIRKGYGAAAISKWFEADERARMMGEKRRHIKASTDVASLMLDTVQDWLEDFSAGRDSEILCRRNEDVEMFNWLARAALIDRGLLGDKACLKVPGRGEGPDRIFLKGEKIVLTRNDYRLKVKDESGKVVGEVRNGTVGTVVRSGRPWNTLIVKTDEGEVVLDQKYLRNHVEGGYASTVAKMQSTTVRGTAHLYQPQAFGAADFLVASSRATDGTYFHFLNQPGGDFGENSPVAEHASDDPVVHFAAMIEKMVWRQDREPISLSATGELVMQQEAQDLARDLGIAGVAAYLSVWQRYATGALSWEEDDVDVATARVDRARSNLEQTMADPESGAEDVRIAADKVPQAEGALRAVRDYQEALHHGGHPDRRYAEERVGIAEMSVAYAEQFGETQPSGVEPEEGLVGISLEPIRRAAGSEGLIDIQDLPPESDRTTTADFGSVGLGALQRSEEEIARDKACDLLYADRVAPSPSAVVAALRAGSQTGGEQHELVQALKAVRTAADTPQWFNDFIGHYSDHCRAQEAEFLIRDGPPPVVLSDREIVIKPAEEDEVLSAAPTSKDAQAKVAETVEQPMLEQPETEPTPAAATIRRDQGPWLRVLAKRAAEQARIEAAEHERLTSVCELLLESGAQASRAGITSAMEASMSSADGGGRLYREILYMAEMSGQGVGDRILDSYRAHLKEHSMTEQSEPISRTTEHVHAAPRSPRSIPELVEDVRAATSTQRGTRALTLNEAILREVSEERERWPEHCEKLDRAHPGGLEMVIWKYSTAEQISTRGTRTARPSVPLPPPQRQNDQGHSF
ncbi:MAG: ATP-dependent DNA helicase [Acidimicrobiales bacterium]